MGREAAENSQERKRRHTDISERQAPALPSHRSPAGPDLPGTELSSNCSRAPSTPGGYICTPAHNSVTAPAPSLQHRRSSAGHLPGDLSHCGSGSHNSGALAHPRGGESLPEDRSLPCSHFKPESSIFSAPARGSGLDQGGSCRNRQSEERALAARTYCGNVLAVCESGLLLHGRAVL